MYFKKTTKLISMIKKLKSDEKLPAIVFVFSKKTLNSLAEKASENLNLVSASERKQILTFFERSVRRLKPHDKQILQISSLKNMLLKGVGVHHGDLLWICKEIVELLFQQNLLKLLFATESFAMGINVPTKSVIFFTIRKMDGNAFRVLKSGEYTQMCGRAGRRGIDKEGFVFVFFGESRDIPHIEQIKPMLNSKGEVLESKFKLTYSTIINSFTMNNFKVKDLMKKSFTENKNYLKTITLRERNELLETDKKKFEIECIYSEKNPLNCKEDVFIVQYERLILQMIEKGREFENSMTGKNLCQFIQFPVFALVVDKKLDLFFMVLYSFRNLQQEHFFEAFLCLDMNKTIQIDLQKNKVRKIRYEQKNNGQIKVLFFDVKFEQILKIINLESQANLQDFKEVYDIQENYEQKLKTEKKLNLVQNLPNKIQQHFNFNEELFSQIISNQCHFCEKLQEHKSNYQNIKKIYLEFEDNEKQLKILEQSFGIETFRGIQKILQDLNFMDQYKLPTINMKFAKTLSSGPEVLLLTLSYNSNLISQLDAFEVPVFLSLLCMNNDKEPDFDELDKIIKENAFSEGLSSAIYQLCDFYIEIKKKEQKYGITFDDFLLIDMLIPIYEWSQGCEFRTLYMFTERMEGYIVRMINKIEKFIESLIALYSQQKKKDVVFKLEKSLALLRRDILNVHSLYLT